MQFEATYKNLKVTETVTAMLEKDGQWRVAGYKFAPVSNPAAIQAAARAAEAWLKLLDQEQYGQCWEQSSAFSKKAIGKQEVVDQQKGLFKKLGNLASRTIVSRQFATWLPGGPDGEYVVIKFQSRYKNLPEAIETVTPMLENDGQWRVAGYQVVPGKLLPAEPTEKLPPDLGAAWAPLFNNKDLAGWKAVGGTPATWKMENGVLRGAGSAGYLVSARSYRDFQLRGEIRISPGASWGLLFRTDPAGLEKNPPKRGLAAKMIYKGQTNDVDGHMRMRVEITRDGKEHVGHTSNIKPNDWFPFELTVKGVDVHLKIANQGGLGAAGPPLPPPAPIILQLVDGNSVLEARNLEIKELPTTAAKTQQR
ncbi:MAG: DUF4019 domain-containing protein [Planctomycetes bacterium]|nr:DUF4019 domain-containing protein [Planctomycetota bacterium]